jgi:ABC-type methionine transport system permease subunit
LIAPVGSVPIVIVIVFVEPVNALVVATVEGRDSPKPVFAVT